VFKDKDGKELGRVKKSESVRTWMHLVLIVGLRSRPIRGMLWKR
jgi:hypothetical protein